jgi:hypothetical protein
MGGRGALKHVTVYVKDVGATSVGVFNQVPDLFDLVG